MVECWRASLDDTFQALSDPTRRAMLHALREGPQSVGDLAAPHDMSFAAASKHVKVLEAAGLLRREIQGRVHLCHLQAAPLADATDYLTGYARFWPARLDALERLLDEQVAHEQQVPAAKPAQRPIERKRRRAATAKRRARKDKS